MDALKPRPSASNRVVPVSEPSIGDLAQAEGQALRTSLPPAGHYGAPVSLGADALAPGKVLQLNGFGLTPAAEFGDLPLEARLQIAEDVGLRRSRRIQKDQQARLEGWQDDYGSHLTEAQLVINGVDGSLGDRPISTFAAGELGRTHLGMYLIEDPEGVRLLKFLPQTGFHDALTGNLHAERLGGPHVHRFGLAELEGGPGRLQGYRRVMFIEMEQLYPNEALGALKQLVQEGKRSGQFQLPRAQIAKLLAESLLGAMIHGVMVDDLDLLVDRHGNGRVIDGDFFRRAFDPEGILHNARVILFGQGHWFDVPGLKEEVGQALRLAVEQAPVAEAKRKTLRDALLIY